MTEQSRPHENTRARHGRAAISRRLSPLFVVFVVLLLLGVAVAYIPAAYSAFTSFKFQLTDYGRYVNTVWNSGHGHPYRLLTEYSYLNTHLSFTLLLLAPVFLIWDHPFALWIAQWLMTLAGIFLMGRAALRQRIPAEVTVALLLFYLASPFTQSVLLSEFHGVGLYLLLLPWLYFCLAFQKNMVWLPLLLTWGVREEAAFLILPMLLYFAIRDRWRGGWLWAAASGLYGVLACTLLFRWINGFSLSSERPGLRPADLINEIRSYRFRRFFPTLTLVGPALPFLYPGWIPILVFPAVALLFTVFSPYPAQYNLRFHYPAALQITFVLGLLQALAVFWQRPLKHPLAARWLQAVFLVTIAAFSYFFHGFLLLGKNNTAVYRHPGIIGMSTMCAVSRIPHQGLLLTDRQTGGMCANRGRMIIWEQYTAGQWQPDSIFTSLRDVAGRHADTLQPLLKNGSYGVSFFDGDHLILVRGYSRQKNKMVLRAAEDVTRTILFAYSKRKGGTERMLPDCRLVRFWQGSTRPGETLVAYGRAVTLAPGEYIARFRLRLRPSDHPGILRINERTSQIPLARAEIRAPEGSRDSFFEQTLYLRIARQTRVEPQVLGAASPLWLDRVILHPVAGTGGQETGDR
ncbi:DUF2079 domain-containing protein [Thermodesulfobacteriota bacterium B35]